MLRVLTRPDVRVLPSLDGMPAPLRAFTGMTVLASAFVLGSAAIASVQEHPDLRTSWGTTSSASVMVAMAITLFGLARLASWRSPTAWKALATILLALVAVLAWIGNPIGPVPFLIVLCLSSTRAFYGVPARS